MRGGSEVVFTFDERGFGFVNGHGGVERSEVRGGNVTEGVSGRDRHVDTEGAAKVGFRFLCKSV